ncbi:MAG: oligopeptide transporter, OPT family [Thermoanaerobaculia bacterium]|nr:oligopeptide transporter, OPT family [Thermoanaerobaculia bacterium]
MHLVSDRGVAEFTLKAVVTGVLLGIVFGAANAYLGLRVGMTVSASIPAAVMAVVAFRFLRLRHTILESNLAQTIGSASTSLATGTIFTVPALFLWGMAPPFLQVAALAFLGGVLGISAMIPLRRLLIVEAHAELPYPEGTACAEVLKATDTGVTQGAWIFRGMAIGAAIKLLLSLAYLLPTEVAVALPVLPKAELALEIAPALFAVGFILGYRQSAVCVAGSVVSSLVLIPLLAWLGGRLAAPVPPETSLLIGEMSVGEIWSRYVRYIGAGAVATAGILTVLASLPQMAGAFAAVARGLRARVGGEVQATAGERERDLPGIFVIGGIAFVVLAAWLVPGIFAGGMGLAQRAVCAAGVGLFGVLFVTVAARIVGIVGVSSQPTSGIALVTLLGTASIFAALDWTGPGAKAAVLTVGAVVAVAASKAGDIAQDLKTGYLVGATPAKQQFGQLIGAAFACWAVAATVLLLGSTYEFGSRELAAPQATLMKTIIEGVLAGALPWDLVAIGGGVAISAMLCGVSGLAFAIGVYLPLSSMAALFVGGLTRRACERRGTGFGEGDAGILAASGLVAGEGLAGVAIAALAAGQWIPKSGDPRLGGLAGDLAALVLAGAVCLFLARASRSRARAPR